MCATLSFLSLNSVERTMFLSMKFEYGEVCKKSSCEIFPSFCKWAENYGKAVLSLFLEFFFQIGHLNTLPSAVSVQDFVKVDRPETFDNLFLYFENC